MDKLKHWVINVIKKCWVVLTKFWVKYGQTQPMGYIFKSAVSLFYF